MVDFFDIRGEAYQLAYSSVEAGCEDSAAVSNLALFWDDPVGHAQDVDAYQDSFGLVPEDAPMPTEELLGATTEWMQDDDERWLFVG